MEEPSRIGLKRSASFERRESKPKQLRRVPY
jgi:hypothetical protein